MKILHTSDWHLGQDFYSYDRTEEHTAFLDQLCATVREEKPDVMVVSGDIYHTATPSNSVMTLFNNCLDRIRQAYPPMQTIIIAGNHDSSSRLEVTRNLWSHLNVTIIGKVEKHDGKVGYGKLIIPVSRDGRTIGYVVALPHIFPNSYPLDDGEQTDGSRMHAFIRHLGETLARTLEDAGTAQLPVVMSAHMAISGSDISGHDDSRGGMDYIPLSDLDGIGFDYLALGHIHFPQFPCESHKIRYCGSPVPVSFDEQYGHSVTIAEVNAHGDEPEIRTVAIRNPWPLKTIPAKAASFGEALKALKALDDNDKSYIRLNVLLDGLAPADAVEKTEQAVSAKACRFCHIKWTREDRPEDAGIQPLKLEEFKELKPSDIAQRYYTEKYGGNLSGRLMEMFSLAEENADSIISAKDQDMNRVIEEIFKEN